MSTSNLNTPDPLAGNLDPRIHHPEFVSREPIEPPSTHDPAGPARTSPLAEDRPASPEHRDSTKAGEAIDTARDLVHEGQEAAKYIGESARKEVHDVTEDVKQEAAHLFEEMSADVRAQATIQQEKLAANLRDISQELREMLNASPSRGNAASLVDQAAHHSGKIAEWLEAREPGDLIQEVKGFARKRPSAFLGLALGAGLLAGRITRNAGGKTEEPAKATSLPRPAPSAATPRESTPMPPTYNDTLGSGGAGGSGTDPGIAYPPPAGTRTDQGYPGS